MCWPCRWPPDIRPLHLGRVFPFTELWLDDLVCRWNNNSPRITYAQEWGSCYAVTSFQLDTILHAHCPAIRAYHYMSILTKGRSVRSLLTMAGNCGATVSGLSCSHFAHEERHIFVRVFLSMSSTQCTRVQSFSRQISQEPYSAFNKY